MIDTHLDQICVPPDATLLQSIAAIDHGANALCCVVDEENRLLAVLTDGDVRRALLGGAALDSPALPHATRDPRTVESGTPRALVIDVMRSVRISAVPEVDDQRRLVGLHTLSDVLGAPQLPNVAVIMAGGRGSRLGDLTASTPKPLMTVAGRSIIEWSVLGLVGGGVRHIFVSVNHLAEQIIDHLGDGSRLGCRIDYLHEQVDKPLGTAGSLTLLPDAVRHAPHPLIVMNGDLMVEFEAERLVEHHRRSGAELTMGVRAYTHTVPFGVVQTDTAHRVTSIAEKPEMRVEINTAVYCLDPQLIQLLPTGEHSTMPELAQTCLDDDRSVAAWTMNADWIDVGTPADLARAKGQA
ncbi:nucleotidyl transferase [Nocardioides sp. S5]|uniref:sugar phosphate nucleotidyltransferase n=1 Tax=Nocardioides sp. S5 TaxID=2017486 RepID=UPI001A8DDBAF|nr:sugar phosphate nucleotidyltransferase [Nocardioides sp. S5]QSR32877.1 nucleotidyl transferase [Nocardioides sp. S5]